MDLAPFTGKGFPGTIDDAIATVPVVGIDRQQAQGMVRLCEQTQAMLYSPEFSPRRIRFRRGSRPRLELIADTFYGHTSSQRVAKAMNWVAQTVRHPHGVGPLVPDRGLGEEGLIDSKIGWCNEQARVFIALCEVMEIPARLAFIFHANARCGHTATEVFLNGRWAFHDMTFGVRVPLGDGTFAEARELNGPARALAHQAYRPALQSYYASVKPFVETCPVWNSKERPSVDAGGDLLAHIGIVNYLIDGVDPVTADPNGA